jgi:hypothetical protein
VELVKKVEVWEEDSNCCQICWSEIDKTKGEIVCGHFFCSTCIQSWSKIENTCPTCRRSFDKINVEDLEFMNNKNKIVDKEEAEVGKAPNKRRNLRSQSKNIKTKNVQNVETGQKIIPIERKRQG